jgi:glycosyltransferase involved in cell wall biosynthesis
MNVLYHHRTRGEDVEAVHIRGIVDGLRHLGHHVDVVSPPGVDVEKTKHAAAPQQKKKNGRSPLSLISRKAPELVFESVEMAYNAYALPVLEAKIFQRDYQLLYERYALFSLAGVLTARRHRMPLILEVNDSAVVNRIRPLKLQAAARRVERFVWNRADAIVTITHYFRDLIIEAGVSPERVHVIPNAVDDQAFGATVDGSSVRKKLKLENSIVVGYVGAINFWRRLDLLVQSFAALAEKHPRARLVLIGEGPDREGVAELAKKLKVAERVHFTGKVAHAEIPAHLAALDIAVIPHSNTYGSPMKLFEYMAAGRTVREPWLPPFVSVIGRDDGGVLFPPLDQAGLTRALDSVLGDETLRNTLGRRAREKVMEDYVWRRHAERILRIHSELA